MRASVSDLLAKPGLKLGHYVGEFTTPGIGYILKEAGCEHVFFDMEHSGYSFETLSRVLRYFEAADLPAFVRVPSDSYDHIARALDCGAQSIIIPMVGSAEQARSVVEKMKYTPKGSRGLAPALGNDLYRMRPVGEFLASANERTKLVCLIETADGIANVDEIAAVDGVDVLWVGHLDLTASMGIPAQFDHSDYVAALDKVAAAGKRNGLNLGRLVTDMNEGIKLAKDGWDLISYHGDVWLLQTAIKAGLETIREGVAKA